MAPTAEVHPSLRHDASSTAACTILWAQVGKPATNKYMRRQFEYRHAAGRGLLHAGKHRHSAANILSGERQALIVWCRSGEYRLSAQYQEVQRRNQQLAEDAEGNRDEICVAEAAVVARGGGDNAGQCGDDCACGVQPNCPALEIGDTCVVAQALSATK